MKKILLIGGDSFIAKQFIYKYKQHYSIQAFSRVKTAFTDEIVFDDFSKIPEKHFQNVDIVINFVAIVHQPKNTNVELYEKINVELPTFLLKQAKKNKVKQFVQMSSVAVYGKNDYITNKSPENPETIYGKSKLKCDELLKTLSNEQIKVFIIRPSMVYGGRMAPGNMQKLISIVKKRIPLPFKKHQNTRYFIHVTNLIDFISYGITNNLDGIFLPTDKQGISTEDLIRIINGALNRNALLFKIPKLGHDILKKISINLYVKLFGNLVIKDANYLELDFNPQFDIKSGVNEMINM